MLYFGGQSAPTCSAQFESLRGERHYDAILVLTDEGGFDLAKVREAPLTIDAPLWMVHLGGRLPAGYDDAMLDAIEKRGGGVAVGVEDAVRGLALPGDPAEHVADGYRWTIEPRVSIPAVEQDFGALAARQFIRARMRSVDTADRGQLDLLHGVATRAAIVSPYSSMIVLVNDAQRAALYAAEQRDDRFERETEIGKEQLTRPFNPFDLGSATAFGTPEPEEWLLLCIAGAILLHTLARSWLMARRSVLS